MPSPVLDVLDRLSEGDQVLVVPDPSDVFTPVFQPSEPFETTVEVVRERETCRVPPEDAVDRRATETDCTELAVLFQPPPEANDAAYATYRRAWPNGTVTGGQLFARNSFYRGREETPTQTELAAIERIERL